MFKHHFFAFFLYFLCPFFATSQNFDLSIGAELRQEYYFQRTSKDPGFFKKEWTADILSGIGADLELKYRKWHLNAGLFATALGFNKNNPDTATGLFTRDGGGRPMIVDNLKYRVHLIEVPLSLGYMFTIRNKFNFKFGLSYSLYFQQRSFIKDISYYEYNIENHQQLSDIKHYLVSNSTDDFNSFSSYFEFEYLFNNFSLSYKAGLRFHTEKYHAFLVDKPFSIHGGVGVNYYLMSRN